MIIFQKKNKFNDTSRKTEVFIFSNNGLPISRQYLLLKKNTTRIE